MNPQPKKPFVEEQNFVIYYPVPNWLYDQGQLLVSGLKFNLLNEL